MEHPSCTTVPHCITDSVSCVRICATHAKRAAAKSGHGGGGGGHGGGPGPGGGGGGDPGSSDGNGSESSGPTYTSEFKKCKCRQASSFMESTIDRVNIGIRFLGAAHLIALFSLYHNGNI
jgi:hypothetical protein